jgi:hypothetical protein
MDKKIRVIELYTQKSSTPVEKWAVDVKGNRIPEYDEYFAMEIKQHAKLLKDENLPRMDRIMRYGQ